MNSSKDLRLGDGLLTGGLLAAFTAAAATCGAGAAHAANVVNPTLPVSFDLYGPSSSAVWNIGGSSVTVSTASDAIDLTMNNGSVVVTNPAGYVASFTSPGAIGAYSQYACCSDQPLKAAPSGALATGLTNGGKVSTKLNSSGDIALFLGASDTPYYLSYTNTITTTGITPEVFGSDFGSNPKYQDVFTVTGISAISAVPEPETWALLVLGLGGLGAALRRRRPMTAAAAAA